MGPTQLQVHSQLINRCQAPLGMSLKFVSDIGEIQMYMDRATRAVQKKPLQDC